MLDWLGDEGRELESAFRKIIHYPPRQFGSPTLKFGGLSDGHQGVQWSAGFNPDNGRRWLSVNLEGIMYENWPIANLILNELARPLLPGRVSQCGRDINGEIVWNRDYWQVTARPCIAEQKIAPTPIAFRDLTEEQWREALHGALACLDSNRNYRGRATMEVTLLASGHRIKGPVSPHLSLQYLGTFRDWESFLTQGKARLEPFYQWAIRQCRPSAFLRENP
ncbi:MAG: hypothetical protein LUO80_07035 [Methylococcaceae bacterium]|nr:hypothetical protein [Methylococcaceae bacterium]